MLLIFSKILLFQANNNTLILDLVKRGVVDTVATSFVDLPSRTDHNFTDWLFLTQALLLHTRKKQTFNSFWAYFQVKVWEERRLWREITNLKVFLRKKGKFCIKNFLFIENPQNVFELKKYHFWRNKPWPQNPLFYFQLIPGLRHSNLDLYSRYDPTPSSLPTMPTQVSIYRNLPLQKAKKFSKFFTWIFRGNFLMLKNWLNKELL